MKTILNTLNPLPVYLRCRLRESTGHPFPSSPYSCHTFPCARSTIPTNHPPPQQPPNQHPPLHPPRHFPEPHLPRRLQPHRPLPPRANPTARPGPPLHLPLKRLLPLPRLRAAPRLRHRWLLAHGLARTGDVVQANHRAFLRADGSPTRRQQWPCALARGSRLGAGEAHPGRENPNLAAPRGFVVSE